MQYNPAADLNKDGKIDFTDYQLFTVNYNLPAATPTPQGFAVGNRGMFYAKTESAVANWQHSQGLISSGKVGAVSRAAIQKISCTRV